MLGLAPFSNRGFHVSFSFAYLAFSSIDLMLFATTLCGLIGVPLYFILARALRYVFNTDGRAVRSPSDGLALFAAGYSGHDIPPAQRDIMSTDTLRQSL